MNELVFLSSKGNPITDSLMVAQVFEKEHKHVLESIRKHIEDLNEIGDEFGGSNFWPTKYVDNQGKERPKYIMNEKGCMSLIMTYTTKKALKIKVAYMNEFDRMKEHIKQQQVRQLDPLQQLAESVIFAQGLIEQKDKIIIQLETKIEEDEPLLKLARSMIDNGDLISIGELANYLLQSGINMGERRLFKYLRENKYLKKNNAPMQRYLEMGLFKRIKHKKTSSGFQPEPTTKVTGKGIEYFAKKLLKELNKEEK